MRRKPSGKISGFIIAVLLGALLLSACAATNEMMPGGNTAQSNTASDLSAPSAGSWAEAPAEPDSSTATSTPAGKGRGGSAGVQTQAGQLTAGEWNDLKEWNSWLNVLNEKEYSQYLTKWAMYPQQRLTVHVTNNDGPISDAEVTLQQDGQTIWMAKSNRQGDAELFVDAFRKAEKGSYQVIVKHGQEVRKSEDVKLEFRTKLDVSLGQVVKPVNTVDLMLVIDTTGSMADELEYITAELSDVVDRVNQANNNQLEFRISTNFYRDRGDNYIVKPYPFVTSTAQAVKQLSEQSAYGGGDYEEAVEQALDDALNNHEWSQAARARLLFLVLDAPPHSTAQVKQQMQKLTAQASEMGVRIIPVSSSGVDKNTEFLMRSMAVFTGGTYTFITNHSGIGGEHIDPSVGEYEVEFLNDMLVRIIHDYVK